MGGFWSGVSTTSTAAKRSAPDQARTQLLQQLLAAELNAAAFGSAPPAHLVESERVLAALPLVEKRHRDYHLQLALVNAVLSVAASLLGGDGHMWAGARRRQCRS